jgi:hypothetical protein
MYEAQRFYCGLPASFLDILTHAVNFTAKI